MFRSIYSLILIIFYFPYIFIIFLRIFFKKEHKSKFIEKFKKNKIKKPKGFLFWFHVASIGEFNSIIPVVDNYLKKNQNNNFLITTITLSSYNEYKKKFGNNPRVFHQFLPYDLNFLVEHFLDSWRPNIVSFVDSEIWPNFIFSIKEKNIPLVLLNARITQKTLLRWLNFKNFSKKIFGLFTICIASSKETETHLEILGANKIKYHGNLKFCSINKNESQLNQKDIVKINRKNIWCAVSTHEGEEIFCSKVQKILNKKISDSACVIIPRHVNRTKKIFSKLKNSGLNLQIKNIDDLFDNSADIVLVNYYGAVNLFLDKIKNVFMGKSLIKKFKKVGGQNPIEAAKLGCNIFHGPYISNFNEIYSFFNKKGFSKEISRPDDLANELIKKFNNYNKSIEKSKIYELNVYSNLIFKKIIIEYENLINENNQT
tara:strand:- start:162 stop:1448 length:1287 start_codon:yes stop_codon:yes gene_type:complete